MSKNTVTKLQAKKLAGEKLVMVTAYDYTSAYLAEQAGVDMILVGDSLGNVIQGHETTVPVTMDEMVYHTRMVSRAAKQALVVADMPFGSYGVSTEQAVANAYRLIKEGGAQAVKLEGSQWISLVKELTHRGIPVVAHLGLEPQIASIWTGYKTMGRDEDSAWALVDAAQDMEEAGAVFIVIECVAAEAAKLITEKVDVPTIGIGCGPDCAGQVLVLHDLLGLNIGKTPHFVKLYAHIGEDIVNAISSFAKEVREGVFPDARHSVNMDAGEAKRIY